MTTQSFRAVATIATCFGDGDRDLVDFSRPGSRRRFSTRSASTGHHRRANQKLVTTKRPPHVRSHRKSHTSERPNHVHQTQQGLAPTHEASIPPELARGLRRFGDLPEELYHRPSPRRPNDALARKKARATFVVALLPRQELKLDRNGVLPR